MWTNKKNRAEIRTFARYIRERINRKNNYQTQNTFGNTIADFKEKENNLIDEKVVFDLHQKTLNKMENISEQYSNADIEGKRLLLGSIFPNKIHFENKKVRTADVNLIFIEINSIKITYKRIKKKDKTFL